MRFFNLSAAKEDLISGMTEAQVFAYAFWWYVLVSPVFFIPLEDLTVYAFEYVFGIACIAIVIGFRQCFIANGGNNGKDFLPRMACLGWVVGWRTLVPFLVIAMLGWILVEVNMGSQSFDVLDSQEVVFVDGILFAVAEIVYWFYLKRSMLDVRRRIEL